MGDEKTWSKEFAECPHCGGKRRMFEEMGKELIERGLAQEGHLFAYDIKQGALADQSIMAKVPIGSELPAFAIVTDICPDCGTIYAVRLGAGRAKKGLAPVQLAADPRYRQFTPNRAQRREEITGGQSFKLN